MISGTTLFMKASVIWMVSVVIGRGVNLSMKLTSARLPTSSTATRWTREVSVMS